LLTAETFPLLVLGAYRDDEVTPAHPLNATVAASQKAGTIVGHIFLEPLSRSQVVELVADTVRRPRREAEPLATLVYDKTAGNPFFAIQFLASLHQDDLIRFDAKAASWRWDSEQIRRRTFSQDVVELIAERLRRLPAVTRETLEIAACVGNTFELNTL